MLQLLQITKFKPMTRYEFHMDNSNIYGHWIGIFSEPDDNKTEINKSNEFAYELWRTGYHEAKLLAVLVFDKEHLSLHEVELLMDDVCSWDLCDHLCKNPIIKLKDYQNLIEKWCISKTTYIKRVAFTLMASAVIHEKLISYDILDDYLKLISEHSDDNREHVKKAVSWALRKIGKRDFKYQ